jgi:integrase
MVQVSYEKKAGPPLGAVAINNELRTLRRVCSFARERKTPIADFKIEMLSEGERRPKAWSAEQLGALLDGCAGHAKEVLPMLVFLANTGARKGEVLALTWDCVDLERREVRIWPSAEWRPKNGKPREIPISDALLPWLSGTKASEKWVFPSGSGERFAFWPKRQWARACEAAKLSGGPHRLRHTFASMFLAQQPDLGLLAVILGHSDEAVTRLYAHMLPARLAKARNVVSVSPPIGAAVFAASQAWGKATVQDADKTGAETGAESAGAAR